MTELERKALLGDKQAQQELTEMGIAIACPLCGNTQNFIVLAPNNIEKIPEKMIGDIDADYDEFTLICDTCELSITGKSFKELLTKWNTRPAPPIGRCWECAQKEKAIVNSKGFLICPISGMEIYDEDYCSYFEPKESEENEID